MESFDAVLGERPNQIERRRDDVATTAADLLAMSATPGAVTEQGLRNDLSVGFQYISFWLAGRGAVPLDNLMEDAATAEIARAQIWQWIRHGVSLDDGRRVTEPLVRALLDQELAKIRTSVGEESWRAGRPEETMRVFEQVALGADFPEFLTLPGYELLA
jgi:malate synthase